MLAEAQWLFQLDPIVGIECLKKPRKATTPPFTSERVLRELKERGGLKACLRYLEYLTFDMKVDSISIHTELACLYVQYIASLLRQYFTGSVLDTARADNDK